MAAPRDPRHRGQIVGRALVVTPFVLAAGFLCFLLVMILAGATGQWSPTGS